jgi:hypothetical protein
VSLAEDQSLELIGNYFLNAMTRISDPLMVVRLGLEAAYIFEVTCKIYSQGETIDRIDVEDFFLTGHDSGEI